MGWMKPQNIIEGSWPSHCMSSIVGLRPFGQRKTKIVSYSYIILLMTCYYILFYFSFDYCDELFRHLEIISKSPKLRRIQMILNVFILPFMILSSLSINTDLEFALLQIHNVDKKLRMFDIQLNYIRDMKIDLAHTYGLTIITIFMGLMEYYSYTYDGTTYMYKLMWITIQFPQVINSIMISTFVITLGRIRDRHAMINSLIVKFNNLERSEVRTIIPAEFNNVFKLRQLRKMYGVCENVATIINAAHRITMPMILVLFIIATFAHVGVAHATFGFQKDTVDFIVDTMWALFYLGKLLYVTDSCHSYQSEGKRAGALLHACRVDANNRLIREENELFARRVDNSNIGIVACDFFTIDYSLVVKTVLTLMIYIFFLSQLNSTK